MIERWAMRIQAYDNKFIYRPGKNNPGDYHLSRHPESFSNISTDINHIAEYINLMVTLRQIQLQTKNNSLLTLIMGQEIIIHGIKHRRKCLNMM